MEKVLSEAVKKQRDGSYAVNYTAVVPVLVEVTKQLDAKQAETTQLRQQVADLRGQMAELRALEEKSSGPVPPGSSAPAGPDTSQVKLEQNAPNPFNEATRIEYALPVGANDAVLVISDMQDRTVRTVTGLAGGWQVVTIQAGSLPAGTYIYTLSVNGKEAVSKRMVLTR